MYHATNLTTGREVTFKSAAKFSKVAKALVPVIDLTKVEVTKTPDPTTSSAAPMVVGDAANGVESITTTENEEDENIYYCDKCQRGLGKSYSCGNCGRYGTR